jgi:dihydrofolate reductase
VRKLIMWNLETLDGCVDGARPWQLDWHSTAWGDELERFSLDQGKEVGTLLFGRVTYEGMAAYWSKAKGETADFMNGVPKVVFSSTLESAGWSNTRLVKGDAADEVAKLKQESGKDLFVFGSARLSDGLMQRGLFDEYRICLAPVVLGAGVPLFKPAPKPRPMTLLEARALKTGAVILRYAPGPVGASPRGVAT